MTPKGRKKADWPWTLAPKKHGPEFPGFVFCLIYPRLQGEEPDNMKMSTGTEKTTTKACSL